MSETSATKELNKEEHLQLELQNNRLVSDHEAKQLEVNARKHWDLFYKRNETRFFKDRHWTTREFTELLNDNLNEARPKVLFEVGCGVGNFIFPLIKDKLNFFIYACDFSPRAVEFVKQNELYDENFVKAFCTDVTTSDLFTEVKKCSVDIVTLVFVLSAIHPQKFETALANLFEVLKPGGVILFRDYGLYDMAQLRFKAGHKISENFYKRQDGTRSYYFAIPEIEELFSRAGFEVVSNMYVHRRTVNKKENIDVPRIFVQSKFKKPS